MSTNKLKTRDISLFYRDEFLFGGHNGDNCSTLQSEKIKRFGRRKCDLETFPDETY
jgi:hypothetical protein